MGCVIVEVGPWERS